MAGCNRMAGLSDGFQVRVSISTIEINTQTHRHTPFSCAYALSARKTSMQRINAEMLMLNAKEPWKSSSFDVRAFVCLKTHFFMVNIIEVLWYLNGYRRLRWHTRLSQLVLWCAYRQENSALLCTELAELWINALKTIIHRLEILKLLLPSLEKIT